MLSQIADFVNWVRRRNPAARTWRDYSYDLRQFASIMGDRSPAEVNIRDIDRFVSCQVFHGFKPTTVNRRLAAILAFFTYLADEDPTLVCPVIIRRHAACRAAPAASSCSRCYSGAR
jgi:site-specific recombinase XerD